MIKIFGSSNFIERLAMKVSNFIFDDYDDKLSNNFADLEKQVFDWKKSFRRDFMLKGQLYYQDEHDIIYRKRTAIGENGEPTEINNIPNNHIIDNQYKKMVKQKVNYLFGKPFSYNTDNDDYTEQLSNVFDSKFFKMIKTSAKQVYNCGIAYVYVYYTDDGKIDFKVFPGYEVYPVWADSEHTVLKACVRIYPVTVLVNGVNKIVEKVEIYNKDGIHRRMFDLGKFRKDIYSNEEPDVPYMSFANGDGAFNWEHIPIIPIKYNDEEISLLKNVKALQDGINIMLSDFENCMQEDTRNTILVLENYDGENLGEFRRNLATYGAVKVRTGEGGGGVRTLEVKIDVDNYKVIVDIFKKALIENAMGYDAKDDKLSGNPNQMNLLSMYNDIDLDADDLEIEYQAFMNRLMWFINAYLYNAGLGDYFNEKVTFTFNRSTLMNEADIIANCNNSSALLSQETILAHHPWVTDPKDELDRLNEERNSKQAEYDNIFSPFKNDNDDTIDDNEDDIDNIDDNKEDDKNIKSRAKDGASA